MNIKSICSYRDCPVFGFLDFNLYIYIICSLSSWDLVTSCYTFPSIYFGIFRSNLSRTSVCLQGYLKIYYSDHITLKGRKRRYNFSMCYISINIPHHLFPLISKTFSLLVTHIFSFLRSLWSRVTSWVNLFSSPRAVILDNSHVT